MLHAVGFSPLDIVAIYAAQLTFVLVTAILIAALFTLAPSPLNGPWAAFCLASALASAAAIFGSVPAVLWPVLTRQSRCDR